MPSEANRNDMDGEYFADVQAEGSDGWHDMVDNDYEQQQQQGNDVIVVDNMDELRRTTSTPGGGGGHHHEQKDTSLLGSIANLCCATLGAGILGLPFGFYQGGIVGSFILLIMAASATLVSIELLVLASQRYQVDTYEDLVERGLGKRARRVTEASIMVFCVGCAVAYLVSIGDLIQLLEPRYDRHEATCWIFFLLLLPLSMLPSMDMLQYASGISVVSISMLVLSAIHHYAFQHTPLQYDKNYSLWWPAETYTNGWLGVILSLLRACPILLFAFSNQVNVCPIYSELVVTSNVHPKAKVYRMNTIARGSISLCSLLYSLMSTISLVDFGENVNPNVFLNYQLDSAITKIAIGMMAIAIMMAYPLNIFPARVTLQGLLFSRRTRSTPPVHLVGTTPVNNEAAEDAMRPSITITDYSSLEEPLLRSQTSQDDVDGEMTPLRTPAAPPEQQQEQMERLLQESSADVLFEWVDPTTTTTAAGPTLFSCTASKTLPILSHIVMTLFLSGISLGLALIVPNISIVFGLLGGTTTSILGFILPGLLGMQMDDEDHHDHGSSSYRTRGKILLVGGALVGVLTTGVTLYTTFF